MATTEKSPKKGAGKDLDSKNKVGFQVDPEDLRVAWEFFDTKGAGKLTAGDIKKRLTPFYKNITNKEIKFLLNDKPEITLNDLHALLSENHLYNFDPVKEAFRVTKTMEVLKYASIPFLLMAFLVFLTRAQEVGMQPLTAYGFCLSVYAIFGWRNAQYADGRESEKRMIIKYKEALFGPSSPPPEIDRPQAIAFSVLSKIFMPMAVFFVREAYCAVKPRHWCVYTAILVVCAITFYAPLLRCGFNGVYPTSKIHGLCHLLAIAGLFVMSYGSVAVPDYDTSTETETDTQRSSFFDGIGSVFAAGMCWTWHSVLEAVAVRSHIAEGLNARVLAIVTGIIAAVALCVALCVEDVPAEFEWTLLCVQKWCLVTVAGYLASCTQSTSFALHKQPLAWQQFILSLRIPCLMVLVWWVQEVFPSRAHVIGAALIVGSTAHPFKEGTPVRPRQPSCTMVPSQWVCHGGRKILLPMANESPRRVSFANI